MIKELTLRNFKSFGPPKQEPVASAGANASSWQGERVRFGALSLIIGTNASGKSNIRDGLRFVHGISRGYSLAEIIGEKYVEGGVLQWKGIRGGLRETVTRNGSTNGTQFTVSVATQLLPEDGGEDARYSITVDVGDRNRVPTVADEWLRIGRNKRVFEWKERTQAGLMQIYLRRESAKKPLGPPSSFRDDRPALTQIPELGSSGGNSDVVGEAQAHCQAFLRTISSIRFLDLDPQSLRRPSLPGQTVLGDKGENLSSVLQALCAKPEAKAALIEWARELTPLDVSDLRFPEVSLEGKIQLQLVEAGGREISAESASDGTLRFLAFAGALLGTEPARFYFFEEIENGIHPNRAHLLVNLLQQATRKGLIQVAGTTHSPAMLNFLEEGALQASSLVYRAGGASRIRGLGDVPELWEVVRAGRAGELHSSGWFETTAAFLEPEGRP